MKKFLSIAITAALLLTCLIFGASAEGTSYVYGNNRFNVEGINVKQGYNGWYFLYSQTGNNGGQFPLDTLKEAEQNPASGQWRIPKSLGLDEDAAKWWGIRSDGFMSPDNNLSAALKWVAPEDGKYTVQIDYWGGTSDTTQETADGVIFFVYYNNTLLSRTETDGMKLVQQADTTVEGKPLKVNQEMELKKGDAFYMITDPKENSGCDNPWWMVDIVKQEEAGPTIPPVESQTPSTPDSSPASNPGSESTPPESGPASTPDASDVSGAGNASDTGSKNESTPAPSTSKSAAVTEGSTTPSSPNNWWIPVVVIAAVVAAAGAVVLVMYLKKIGPFAKPNQ